MPKPKPPARKAAPRRLAPTLNLTGPQNTSVDPLSVFKVAPGSTPGGIRAKGREMVGSVNSAAAIVAGAFTLLRVGATTSILLVPATFPRLNAYTPIYEYYKFHTVKYSFVSNQPTTAGGTIMMGVEYDVKDNPPASSIAIMRNLGSTMANIYSAMETRASSLLSRLPKYATSEDTATDIAQINQARLDIACEGITVGAATTFGYLVVEYDVEFFTPQ